MPQITITVHNKPYTLSCPAGNESHVERLAGHVNAYIDNLVKHGANLSNQGLLVFALLGMAEKIEDLQAKIAELDEKLNNPLASLGFAIETPFVQDLSDNGQGIVVQSAEESDAVSLPVLAEDNFAVDDKTVTEAVTQITDDHKSQTAIKPAVSKTAFALQQQASHFPTLAASIAAVTGTVATTPAVIDAEVQANSENVIVDEVLSAQDTVLNTAEQTAEAEQPSVQEIAIEKEDSLQDDVKTTFSFEAIVSVSAEETVHDAQEVKGDASAEAVIAEEIIVDAVIVEEAVVQSEEQPVAEQSVACESVDSVAGATLDAIPEDVVISETVDASSSEKAEELPEQDLSAVAELPDIDSTIEPLDLDAERSALAFLEATTQSLEQWQNVVSDVAINDNVHALKQKQNEISSVASQISMTLEQEMQQIASDAKKEQTEPVAQQVSKNLDMAEDSNRLLNDVLDRIANLARKLESAD